MPNMVFELNGDLFVTIHRATNPDPDEWESYMQVFRKLNYDKTRQLVFSDGGGPNSQQRKVVNDLLQGHPSFYCSVVTPSTVAVGIVTALNWVSGTHIKAFKPEETHLAFAHLGMKTPSEVEWGWRIVQRLSAKLGDSSLRSLRTDPLKAIGA